MTIINSSFITSDVLLSMQIIQDDDMPPPEMSRIWEFCAKRPGPHGGHIYDFKISEIYKNLIGQKNREIFPAIEPDASDIMQIISLSADYRDDFNLLGYDLSTKSFSLPDAEALKRGFEVLKKKYRHLQPLDIRSCPGTATEEEFIETFCQGADVILSTGREFVHDHFNHVMYMILTILMNQRGYYLAKNALAQMIKNEVLVRMQYFKTLIHSETDEKKKQVLTQMLGDVKTTMTLYIDLVWIYGPDYRDLLKKKAAVFNTPPYHFTKLWSFMDYQAWRAKQPLPAVSPSLRIHYDAQWRRFRELTEPQQSSSCILS